MICELSLNVSVNVVFIFYISVKKKMLLYVDLVKRLK